MSAAHGRRAQSAEPISRKEVTIRAPDVRALRERSPESFGGKGIDAAVTGLPHQDFMHKE